MRRAGEEGTSKAGGGTPNPEHRQRLGGGCTEECGGVAMSVSPCATVRWTHHRRGGGAAAQEQEEGTQEDTTGGGGQHMRTPPHSKRARGTRVCKEHRDGAMLLLCLCKVTPQPHIGVGGVEGAVQGWGGGVSSTCLAAASSSPSVSCAWGRGADNAAPAGSEPRGIWASPGNSGSAGRSHTGGQRGRRRGGGGGWVGAQ